MPVDGDVILKAGLDTTGISKTLNNLQKTVSKGLKNAIRIGFGVRSIYALIRKLRKALFDGFGNLAQVSEPFNSAMSSMMNALAGLKSSFASAFSPIIQVVAPAITTFLNLVSKAVDAVGKLIAALTGQKDYIKYIPTQQDYAQSLADTSSNANKASKSLKNTKEEAKKLERQLMKFDDINILKEDDDKDKTDTTTPSVGSSGAGSSAIAGVENLSLDKAFTDLAEKIKEAWKNADFTEIGKMVGEKINDALNKIPWDKIKETSGNIASSIATFINGALSTPELAKNIGKTIGEAIDTALTFVATFIKKLDWGLVGTSVREMIISALRTIDWDLVYSAAADFGTGLASYLNGLFTEDLFTEVGETAADLLNSAFEFLNKFGDTFNFTQFGSSLAAGINRFLNKFDTVRLTAGINKFITGFRDAIVSFLTKVNWDKFGEKIREIILGIKWEEVLKGFGEVFWEAINAVVEFFNGLFNIDPVVSPFTNAVSTIKETLDEIGKHIDFDSIGKGIEKIVTALKPVGDGFAQGFSTFFKALKDIGIVFFTLLGPALEKIGEGINLIPEPILRKIGEALGILVPYLVTIKTAELLVHLVTNLPIIGAILPNIASGASAAKVAIAGLTAALGPATVGIAIFVGALLAMTEDIATTEEELAALNGTHQDTIDIVKEVGKQYGLTSNDIYELAWELHGATEEGTDMAAVYALVDKKLENAGISTNDFKDSLASAASTAKNNGKDISEISSYIEGVGTASEETSTQTSGVSTALDTLNGMSWTTPIKLALISGAIAALASQGKLSDEQVTDLQQALDEYDPDKPEQSMGRIATVLDNAGVSADDFVQAVALGMPEATKSMSKEELAMLGGLNTFTSAVEKQSKKAGNAVGDGTAKGMEDKKEKVTKSTKDLMNEGVIDAAKDALDSNSPSKEMASIGEDIDAGLVKGLNAKKSTIIGAIRQILSNMNTVLVNYNSTFKSSASGLMASINSGIVSGGNTLKTTMSTIASGMQSNINSVNWWNVGDNIAVGIYNGLIFNANWLYTLAWNTAVGMYNSACKALGIASPSKKFAWVGEMITKGLGEGIIDNQDNATNAVDNLTASITKEAESANPTVNMGTVIGDWISDLDNVLVAFSDRVIDRFDKLTDTLANLTSLSSYGFPDISQGKVVPAAVRVSNNSEDTLSNVNRSLEALAMNQITTDDLHDMLVEMFNEYMNFGFYIGDEQIARHANAGNVRLNRRYRTTGA